MATVQGQIAHPVGRANPYRIGRDGVPRVLPGSGGIVINFRIGDRCVGLAGDHIEPGVALHNNGREVVGPRDGPNNALLTYACVGNRAEVLSGRCSGKRGLVTGKHGGVNHVLVDFPFEVLRRLAIGDRVQIFSLGLGLRLLDYPQVHLMNCSPGLLKRWGIVPRSRRLMVPATHVVPAAVMGSGLGKSASQRGDYDIQLADPEVVRRFRLGSLRFGDLIAIVDGDNRYGPLFHGGRMTFGVIVHGDSTVSGHGPGVTALMTGPATVLQPTQVPGANLAALYRLRPLPAPRHFLPLAGRQAYDFLPHRTETRKIPAL